MKTRVGDTGYILSHGGFLWAFLKRMRHTWGLISISPISRHGFPARKFLREPVNRQGLSPDALGEGDDYRNEGVNDRDYLSIPIDFSD
jgi:hypothetical protein